MKCHACHKGKVVDLAVAGRTLRHRSLANLPVPATLPIPTCDHCGEQWLSPADAARVDEAMAAAYRLELRRRARALIEGLPNTARVERDLGLSPGYLARLRSGKRVASADLLAFLAVIAKAPEVLETVEAFWRESAPAGGAG